MSETTAEELLSAVRQFLREQVLPELQGFKAYNTRVAANALGIVARELELGMDVAELDEKIAMQLGLEEQAVSVSRQIALALRNGRLVVDSRVLTYLQKRTQLAIAINNPKYSGLQQARELWGG
jgi:phytoene/squalene synthetase